MDRRHTASASIDAGDAAMAVVEALRIEAADPPPGTHVSLRVEGASVVIDVAADDVSGLRAALAGMLRLAAAAADIARA